MLRKELDKAKTEKRRASRHKDKSKRGSFFEFSHDPASIEREAGRVAGDARQVKLATGEGGLLIHYEDSNRNYSNTHGDHICPRAK